MLAVIITFIWSIFGTNTIIFITGMATLDRDIYEAARVDGAGSFAIFWRITIPMLMRFIQFAFILTLITAFTALFSLIFVMTGGGPGYGTTTLEFYVYQQAFSVGVFGYAAAIGIVLFAIVFAISLGADCGSSAAGWTRRRAMDRTRRRLLTRAAMFLDPLLRRRGHALPVRLHGHDRLPVVRPVHRRIGLLAGQLGRPVRGHPGRPAAHQLDDRHRRRGGAHPGRQRDRPASPSPSSASAARASSCSLVLAGMMIPLQSIIIPEFVNISQVGLVNQYLGRDPRLRGPRRPVRDVPHDDLLPGPPERAGRGLAHGRRLLLADLPRSCCRSACRPS